MAFAQVQSMTFAQRAHLVTFALDELVEGHQAGKRGLKEYMLWLSAPHHILFNTAKRSG